MVTGEDNGRIAQGIPDVGAPPVGSPEWVQEMRRLHEREFREAEEARKAEEERSLKGRAKKALDATKTAAGTAYGKGKRLVAQPANGFKGLFLNFWPENEAGVYVILVMFVYWVSWMSNFTGSVLIEAHITLAVIGFVLFVYSDTKLGAASFMESARSNGILFSVMLIFDLMLLGNGIKWNFVILAALLLALREGRPAENFKRVAIVMGTAAVAYYVYIHIFNLFLPNIARISFPLNFELWSVNFGILPFIIALLLNRAVTYPFFWYSIFGLSSKTRVARSIAWVMMFAFIFAMWPHISPGVNRLHDQYAQGTTSDQKGQVTGFFKTAFTNFFGTVGNMLRIKTTKIIADTENAFSFGTHKETPKVGLQLVDDPTMQTEVKLNYHDLPIVIFDIKIENPLPADLKMDSLQVTNIMCLDAVQGGKAISLPGNIQSGTLPTYIQFGDDKPGICSLIPPPPEPQIAAPGLHSVDVKATYRIDEGSYMSTAIMRQAKLESLLRGGVNPALPDKIPRAIAEYDNGPVAITWWPVTFAKAPISDANANLLGIVIQKNGGWEGDIEGIETLELTLPQGLSLNVNDVCSFNLTGVNADKTTTYEVDPARIKSTDKDKPLRFIGSGPLSLQCGMNKIDDTFFNEADWGPATFKATGTFLISIQKKGISVNVIGKTQAGQDLCTKTGGTWEAGKSLCTCKTGEWSGTIGCTIPAVTP